MRSWYAADSGAKSNGVGKCEEVGEAQFVVPKELLLAMQERPEALIREGRWIPSAKEGVQAWRAVHVRRGSLLASCGIRNGDVLMQVNASREPSEWLSFLKKASGLESAELEIRRANKSIRLDYVLD